MAPPLGLKGMTGAPETPPPTCIRPTMPNLVVRYVRAHEDPPEEMGSSRPVFRGHSRSSEPTRIDGYTYNFSIVISRNHGGPISHIVFETIGVFGRKIAISFHARAIKVTANGRIVI